MTTAFYLQLFYLSEGSKRETCTSSCCYSIILLYSTHAFRNNIQNIEK